MTSRFHADSTWGQYSCSPSELAEEIQTWQEQRDAEANALNWQFTIANARIKPKRLYPENN